MKKDAVIYSDLLQPVVAALASNVSGCRAHGTSCVRQIRHAFVSSLHQAGFQYARFAYWRVDRVGDNRPSDTYSHTFSSFPEAWEQRYLAERFHEFDPVAARAREVGREGSWLYGSWDDAFARALARLRRRDEPLLRERIRGLATAVTEAGFADGFYMAYGQPDNAIFISAARQAGRPGQPASALWASLLALCVLLDKAIQQTLECTFCAESLMVDGGLPTTLSERQRQVLRAFAASSSATAKSVALDLGVGADTISYHLRALRQKLGRPRASGHALAKLARDLRLIS